jgi:hypothetical protein
MEQKQELSYDLLKKYGSKWAVLVAMSIDLTKRGIKLPDEVDKSLQTIRIEITSGCYSTCEVGCTMGVVEGHLIACGSVLGDNYLNPWIDLFSSAIKGELEYESLVQIPALEPVKTSCGFLKCGC